MKQENDYNLMLDSTIDTFFHNAMQIIGGNPAMLKFIAQTIRFQKKAAVQRSACRKEDLQVPPYMIISVTNRCNLQCKGCYSQAQQRPLEEELGSDRLRTLLKEAKDLGISFVFLAGGEPLMRPDLLEVTKDFPEVIFPLFTNGLLLSDKIITCLRKQKNVIPILSMEGHGSHTDTRRGAGVHDLLQETIEKLKKAGIFFGLSFTVTRINFDTLTEETFIDKLITSGCQLFFFVEYIPVEEMTKDLVITETQRPVLASILESFRERFPGLFISFPGDEEVFGGCLSAGRGFIHISAGGDLEPCPFAPYSDTNIRELPLKEALRSGLLCEIRKNHGELSETKGGCALWEKRDWVMSLL